MTEYSSSQCTILTPYRITPSDREGPPLAEQTPHTCSHCNLIMVNGYQAALSKVAMAIDNGCDLIRFCYEVLDPKWGRPKDGITLIEKVREAGELENVKLRIDIYPEQKGADRVNISTSTIGVSRFTRGIGSPKTFKVMAREGKCYLHTRSLSESPHCPCAGDPAAAFFPNRPINRVVRSERGMMLSKVKAMIVSSPLRTDPDYSGNTRPARLIDLGGVEDEISPSIIEIGRDWNQQYACLSKYLSLLDFFVKLKHPGYCWGTGPRKFVTTRDSLPGLKHGFSYNSLPATIRDSCLVTKLFGCRYLWIDALCIVQDDAKDQAQEIPKMRSIYRNAVLTICATRSSSVWDGFLADRTSQTLSGPYLQLAFANPNDKTSPHGNILLFPTPNFTPTLTPDFSVPPLHTRGWTFQERVLSARVLEFDTEHTSFQDA